MTKSHVILVQFLNAKRITSTDLKKKLNYRNNTIKNKYNSDLIKVMKMLYKF